MVDESHELPENIDALKSMVRHYIGEVAKRDATVERRERQIAKLQAEINKLLAKRFGQSSEKVSEAQLGLFNEAEVEADQADAQDDAAQETAEVAAHRRRRGKRRPLPEDLPRTVVVHDLTDEEKVCPHDGTMLELIDEQCSEQLRVIPAKFEVVVHKRLKYACPCCRGHIRTAALPAQPIPKSMASAELLAYVATAKYADALPLYRQSKQFARIGVDLPRQTLARWMMQVGTLIVPVINLLRDELLAQTYMQMDETTFQVLKEPGKAAQTKSQLWVQRAMSLKRPVVLFSYRASRSAATAAALLEGFQGILQTDLYAGYHGPGLAAGVVHAHCIAHARRFFVDGLKGLRINVKRLPPDPPPGARQLLKGLTLIRGLYAIERRIKDHLPDVRLAVRQAESSKVLEQLEQWVGQTRPRATPTSDLGKGLRYIENHWHGLTYFMHDGRVEIDTNLTEGEIRPFAVGRRNWLFSDTPRGADASAAIYTTIVTAKANSLDPYSYLCYVIKQLTAVTCVEDVEALLPWNLTPEKIVVI